MSAVCERLALNPPMEGKRSDNRLKGKQIYFRRYSLNPGPWGFKKFSKRDVEPKVPLQRGSVVEKVA